MEANLIVPGHGPITDKHGVAQVRHYLQYVHDQARSRYDAGMTAFEAAKDIELSEYSSWSDPERIAVNVDSLYREFSDEQVATDTLELMGRWLNWQDLARQGLARHRSVRIPSPGPRSWPR